MGQIPTVDADKYLEVLQYLLRSEDEGGANNDLLGKVKLMKLLYFADFEHFYRYGSSITGDTYVKREYGPVPRRGAEMIAELVKGGRLNVERSRVIDFYRYRYELTGLPAPVEHLTWEERATLNETVRKWRGQTTAEIVSTSHGDPPWLRVAFGEAIPYHTVHYRDDLVHDDEDEPEAPIRVRAVS